MSALMLCQIDRGWAVITTDGQTLARFTGFAARGRAERYMQRYCGIGFSFRI